MKVLHLPYGIGISTMSHALRAQGVDATSCSFKSKNYYNYLADVCLNVDQYPLEERYNIRKAYFREVRNNYDIFHFHFGETFLPDKRDLKKLARLGKKMVVDHRGSEVRTLSIARHFNNPYVCIKKGWTEKKIHRNLKLLSAYIDHAIVPDHELVPYIEPYYKKIHVVPRAMDTSQIKTLYPTASNRPLIVHAPTNREVKGTVFIQTAIERLKREGLKFKFKLIEKLPHEEAIQLYRQSDIVIDQLLIGAYANLSMEAMAMGKPVICYIRDDLLGKYPPGLPIINANPDTLYDVLKDLLNHPERWRDLGKEGRRYVRQHHSLKNAAFALMNIYNEIVK